MTMTTPTTHPGGEVLDGSTLSLATPRVTTAVVLVSAEVARRWLARQRPNRKLSPLDAARWRSEMASGRWVFDASPLRFDTEGYLLDGQHRLTALASLPGLVLPFLVVRGLPHESQRVMDQGRKRTASDQLTIAGVKNASLVASGVALYVLWTEGTLFRDSHLIRTVTSAPRIAAWVDNNPERVLLLDDHVKDIKSNDAMPSVAYAAALRFSEVDERDTFAFFHTLATGGASSDDPVTVLDKRLQRDRRRRTVVTKREQLAMFVQAWNARRRGFAISRFVTRPRGASWTAENFPEVWHR